MIPGTILTALHFLFYLQMGPISNTRLERLSGTNTQASWAFLQVSKRVKSYEYDSCCEYGP